jgi:protein-S-isoprenylcysteine O-methyltransferase Ste14
MLRTVVDTVPTGVLVLAVVGFVVAIVLLGVWAVRRFVPSTRDGFDAEVSSQVLGVVASLFGLLLAFVVVIEFQAFSSAGDNVQTEADDLGAIVRDSYAFGDPAGGKIRTAIGHYVNVVVADEWPLMRDGKGSPEAWQGIDDVFAAMQAYKPVSTSEVAFYDDSVRHLNAVLEARSNRLDSSDGNDLPLLIAALILVGAVVILGYATLVGSTSSAFHAIGAGAIAVVVGFALVVLVALQFPFSGGLAVDSRPFRGGALAPFFSPQ